MGEKILIVATIILPIVLFMFYISCQDIDFFPMFQPYSLYIFNLLITIVVIGLIFCYFIAWKIAYYHFQKQYFEIQCDPENIILKITKFLNDNNVLIDEKSTEINCSISKIYTHYQLLKVFHINNRYLLEFYYWDPKEEPRNVWTYVYFGRKRKKYRDEYNEICYMIMAAIKN